MIKYTELTALLETNSVTLIILSTLVWCYNPFQSQCDTAWWASEDKCGAGETEAMSSLLLVSGSFLPL